MLARLRLSASSIKSQEGGYQITPNWRSVLWITLVLSLLTHSAYLALDHEHYGVDTPTYLIPADNLLHGQGFVNALHQPELRRTPGYPLLLALFQIAPLRVEYLIFLQHLLCVVLTVAVAAFALRSSRLAAITAAAVMSLDLATLRIANLLMTEITTMVLITLAAWFLYRAMTKPEGVALASAAAGLLGGCATLVRPVGVLYFVPLSICLFLALRRRALRPALIFVATFLLLPALWTARNFTKGHYLGI